MLRSVGAGRLVAMPVLFALLSGCGDSVPSCSDQSVLETVERLIIQTSGVLAMSKGNGCFGGLGCIPYFDGDKLQFHTLAIRPGTVRVGEITSGNAIYAKATFSVPKDDFLRAITFEATNIRTMAKDADAREASCAADVVAKKLDLGKFQGKLPDNVVEYEGFDGKVYGWMTTKENRTTGLEALRTLYQSIHWTNPVRYSAQRTSDGKIYVTLQQR